MVRNCDRLSAEELWRFHNDGFVVLDCRLPQDVVAEMREAYDELLSANPGFSSDFMLGPHLETTGAQGVRGSRRWLGAHDGGSVSSLDPSYSTWSSN